MTSPWTHRKSPTTLRSSLPLWEVLGVVRRKRINPTFVAPIRELALRRIRYRVDLSLRAPVKIQTLALAPPKEAIAVARPWKFGHGTSAAWIRKSPLSRHITLALSVPTRTRNTSNYRSLRTRPWSHPWPELRRHRRPCPLACGVRLRRSRPLRPPPLTSSPVTKAQKPAYHSLPSCPHNRWVMALVPRGCGGNAAHAVESFLWSLKRYPTNNVPFLMERLAVCWRPHQETDVRMRNRIPFSGWKKIACGKKRRRTAWSSQVTLSRRLLRQALVT